MKRKRVVITGMGVVAPNATGLPQFEDAIKAGKSGIKFHQELKDLKFSCQVGGVPKIPQELLDKNFTALEQRGLLATGLIYGGIAGQEAWTDAKLSIKHELDTDSGIIFGTGVLGVEKLREAFNRIDDKQVRRLGSTSVLQTMASGISAFLGGRLGCGNQVTSNSSACSTGTEALLMGFERIQFGKAKRMLVGSCSDSGPYVWGGFDALRILPHQHNATPESASQPLSAAAAGFVPSSGAGALVLEDLESALERDAHIYAEVLGGHVNAGGQRENGSMTAPNSTAVKSCISQALLDAGVNSEEIDLINGHLTATAMDSTEIENWSQALGLSGKEFPYINSLKSHIGHALAAAGSIELVSSVLELSRGFIFPNINCDTIHPEVLKLIDEDKIPRRLVEKKLNLLAKASFGFGDVNACVILKSYDK
ncbi:beta-ketoacyl-[acyl-carrier-protein] synthase family protein [Psychroflexus montanilacus]|uniref:beta-ketoacyl-[acyl-carrier-protein] synthase family protein n=1 Tax=Psychroflexus montanilacus TaxID=2873598 RepID=UPI001CCA0176|nr:beta-ketoacyl-[acyl-carrier-protein] synthase family protein [Psychroflexus montanilacus]MBZ9651171.1 beta-ketoacyl-[acyl-carrier-protein] synthase family protein [Psychroflexus montanilacus]